MSLNDIGKKSNDMLDGKERSKFLGIIIGVITKDFPNVEITCFGGDIILGSHRLFFNPSLLKGYLRKQSQTGELTVDLTASPADTGGFTGTIPPVPPPPVAQHIHHNNTFIGEGDYTAKDTSEITYEDYELKKGDNVALFPIDGTNQYWVAGGALTI